MSTSTTLGLHPKFATIPLISSSLALFYAYLEYTIFKAFLQSAKSEPKSTNRAVRLWWTNWLPYGLYAIAIVILPSATAGLYALRKLPKDSVEFALYATGTGFSLGHFVFGLPISRTISAMCDEDVEKKGETLSYLKEWLRLHAWRTALMDVPAGASFAWLVFRS